MRRVRRQRPEHLRVLGHVDVRQRLRGAGVRPLVQEAAAAPVPAVGVRHNLMSIGSLLAHLLLAAVDVADVGLHVRDLLAVELDVQCMTPCVEGWCGPMLRCIVCGPHGGLEQALVFAEGRSAAVRIVVQPERVTLPRLRQEDAAQVGWSSYWIPTRSYASRSCHAAVGNTGAADSLAGDSRPSGRRPRVPVGSAYVAGDRSSRTGRRLLGCDAGAVVQTGLGSKRREDGRTRQR